MAKNKNHEEEIFDEEDIIVEMTDDEGNVYYYSEELIIPIGEDKFALLVEVHPEDEEEHHHDEDCDCGCGDDVIIAKIVLNEDGEEEYIEPTDEEFEMVQKEYDRLMEDEE